MLLPAGWLNSPPLRRSPLRRAVEVRLGGMPKPHNEALRHDTIARSAQPPGKGPTMIEYRPKLLEIIAAGVKGRLDNFDEATGRFITEPTGPVAPGANPEDLGWAVTNQDIMYALATVYVESDNPYHRDPDILEIAGRAGDAVRDFQDPEGRVEFVKRDGSRWGKTYMCWTNYAWLEAFALLREYFDDERRERWEEGLTLAHDGQAEELRSRDGVHNIPTWKAMSCWRAGEVLGREDWQEAARQHIPQVVEAQKPGGFWPEHGGPTTGYNRVYLHALGLYHIFSGDDSVLPAIERATDFHQTFTWPDGSDIKVIDGRTKYSPTISLTGLVSMTLTPQGRRYARYLFELPHFARSLQNTVTSHLSSLYHHMHAGDEEPINLDEEGFETVYEDWAILKREGPWMGCLSAFTCPPTSSRWGQDRQQFISLWHEDAGLLIGGGNSRNQPEWSTFVTSGRYIPDTGEIADGAVVLTYGDTTCRIGVDLDGDAAVIEARAAGNSAINHLTVPLGREEQIAAASGRGTVTGDETLRWGAREMGEWLQMRGFEITLPEGAYLLWPTVPFNPYAIDGAAGRGSETAVISAPVEDEPARWRIELAEN